jgi:hypothetical protein
MKFCVALTHVNMKLLSTSRRSCRSVSQEVGVKSVAAEVSRQPRMKETVFETSLTEPIFDGRSLETTLLHISVYLAK